jgi:hypothetical protein
MIEDQLARYHQYPELQLAQDERGMWEKMSLKKYVNEIICF